MKLQIRSPALFSFSAFFFVSNSLFPPFFRDINEMGGGGRGIEMRLKCSVSNVRVTSGRRALYAMFYQFLEQ